MPFFLPIVSKEKKFSSIYDYLEARWATLALTLENTKHYAIIWYVFFSLLAILMAEHFSFENKNKYMEMEIFKNKYIVI